MKVKEFFLVCSEARCVYSFSEGKILKVYVKSQRRTIRHFIIVVVVEWQKPSDHSARVYGEGVYASVM